MMWALTVCLFMVDPALNKCYDFRTRYESFALCEKAGETIEKKYLKSETVAGVARKCETTEK